jgi:hypothetical protein
MEGTQEGMMPRPKKVIAPVTAPAPAPKVAPVAPPVVEKKQPVSTFVMVNGKEWTFLVPFVGEIKSVGIPFETEDYTFVELNGETVVAVRG